MLVASNAREYGVICRIHVAVGTSGPSACMRARVDWEPAVAKRCTSPGGRTVTGIARGGELRSNVVRVCGARVISLVARITVCRRSCVNAVYVAIRTRDVHVCSGQREAGLAVVERSWLPRVCRVAHLAIGRELRLYVVRIRSTREVLHVTRGARGAQAREHPV